MPFDRPALTDLQAQGQQDIVDAGIEGVDALLPFSMLGILSWVQAQLAWLHYEYLDWIARQAVPWTATDEYLAGWGNLKNVSKKPATVANDGYATFTATAGQVTSIPAGTVVTRSDGFQYSTTVQVNGNIGTITVPLTAGTAGSAGNAAAGTQVALGSPVPGVQTAGTITTAATAGADTETDAEYQPRVIAAYQATGSDGREAEYIGWATAVPGVTRAWVNRNGFGAGTVVIYVMLDDAEAAGGGFPIGSNGAAAAENRYAAATGDQLRVANAIYPVQAVTALVIVCAPIAQPVDFAITDLGVGNTPANQAAITAALQDMFRRVSAPGGTVHPNSWEGALEAIGTLTTFDVASPASPVAAANVGSMPVLGAVTFAS